MTSKHPTATLIPWFANGTLGAKERREVEEHLAGCASCRALLEESREFRTLGEAEEREMTEPDLLDHVHAQHLEDYARDPGALEPHLAKWVGTHLEACAACMEAMVILQPLVRQPAAGEHPAGSAGKDEMPMTQHPGRVGPRAEAVTLWSLLSRTLLHPVAAAAYLLILLLVIPLYVARLSGPPAGMPGSSEWSGTPELVVLSSATRGDDSLPQVRVEPGQPLVLLGCDFALPSDLEPPATVLLAVRQDGREVWSHHQSAGRLGASLATTGLVTVAIPQALLPEGSYTLAVEDTGSGRSLLERGFQVVRPAD